MRKFTLIILCILFISVYNLQCQISFGGIPYMMLSVKSMSSPVIEMPSIDSSYINSSESTSNKAYRISYNHSVNINPLNTGKWIVIGDTLNVWSVTIRSRKAEAIGVVFNSFQLRRNEKIFIYNSNKILGAYTKESNPNSSIFAVQPIQGDMITIEFSTTYTPAQCGSFSLEKIAHVFVPWQEPGSCNVDINCAEGDKWQEIKKAVVKLVVYKGSTGELCSGSLINNTAQDGKPYLLTANHCIYHDGESQRTVFYFNYESPFCNGPKGSLTQTLNGSVVKATNYEHDFTLIELNQHPPMGVKPYYAGWSRFSDNNIDTVVCIHHPWGGTKKIAVSNSRPERWTFYEPGEPAYAQDAFFRIARWDVGVTEKGSSGGSLFDIKKRIVGSLTGGQAVCGSPVNDYFESFADSYEAFDNPSEQLKVWLDPLNTGVYELEGFNPYTFDYYGCDTLSNIRTTEEVKILNYEYGNGFYSGNNADSIYMFAEKFGNTDSIFLSGAVFNIGKTGISGGLTVYVYQGIKLPETLIYEKYIEYNLLTSNKANFIEFYPKVTVKGNFFIAYRIPYNSTDTFNMYQASPRMLDGRNTAYIFKNKEWIAMNNYTAAAWGTAFDIKPLTCNPTNSVKKPINISNSISCYPNPAKNKITINYNDQLKKLKLISANDIYGRQMLLNYLVKGNLIEIDVNDLSPGLYLINLYTATGKHSTKFIKVR